MSRLPVLRRGVLCLMLMVNLGCSGEPPVIQEARKVEEAVARPVELKPPAKPKQSEPEALKILNEALAAHTGGKPERLTALKTCTYSRTGTVETPNGRMRSTWKMHMGWPECFRVLIEMQGTTIVTRTYGKSPSGEWVYPGATGRMEKSALQAEDSLTFVSQMQEDSITLLFGLIDPSLMVTRATDETIDGIDIVGLHVWTSGLSYARLSFDKATKRLRRMVYNGRESTTFVVKDLFIVQEQEFDGITLGTKLLVKGGGRWLAEWNDLAVDTRKAIDPKLFDSP